MDTNLYAAGQRAVVSLFNKDLVSLIDIDINFVYNSVLSNELLFKKGRVNLEEAITLFLKSYGSLNFGSSLYCLKTSDSNI